jgi:hypothetical protein
MFAAHATDLIDLPRMGSAIAPLLERLLVISSDQPRIVSAYLRFDPEDRLGGAYLLTLKDEIRRLHDDPALQNLDHASREGLAFDLRRILQWAESGAANWPTPALAIFSWEAGSLFEVIPLPGVLRTRVVVDRTPRVRDLVAAEPFTRPVLTVLLDRAHVRIFEADFQGVVERSDVFVESSRGGKFHSQRKDAPGWGERDFHNRRDEESRHQHAEIVSALEVLVLSKHHLGIALAGPRDRTTALAADLPPALTSLLLGDIRLNPPSATPAEVKAATREVVAEAALRLTQEAVREFQDAMGRGLAVEGIRETLRAVSLGQVRMLLIGERCAGAGFRCGAGGRLVLSAEECREAGEPVRLPDVVDEAVEDALRKQASIMTVPEPAADELLDGIGAFLRYPLP